VAKTCLWLVALSVCCFHASAWSQANPKAPAKTKTVAARSTSSKLNSLVPSSKPSLLSTPLRKPASFDPNSAVEIRGQARTLSMMLVLKNGKDGINFIKVRKDYKPEIQATDF
jgi:hypothetical protein